MILTYCPLVNNRKISLSINVPRMQEIGIPGDEALRFVQDVNQALMSNGTVLDDVNNVTGTEPLRITVTCLSKEHARTLMTRLSMFAALYEREPGGLPTRYKLNFCAEVETYVVLLHPDVEENTSIIGVDALSSENASIISVPTSYLKRFTFIKRDELILARQAAKNLLNPYHSAVLEYEQMLMEGIKIQNDMFEIRRTLQLQSCMKTGEEQ